MSASAPRPDSPSSSQHEPILPPVPFDDFQFFNANAGFHGARVPPPLSLPSSNDLFSASETTDLFGFLENFDWDFNADAFPQLPDVHSSDPLYRNPLQETAPPGLDQLSPSSNLFTSQPDPPQQQQHYHQLQAPQPPPPPQQPMFNQSVESNPPMPSRSRSASTSSSPSRSTPSASVGPRVKPLLSTPQKRLNHIMSEQKRRNAIRDGYLQLTTLLAPAGAPPGSGMPTRGRPKGSGSRGRGTKGKSGILFRARAYIQWLEEGTDALREEVTRMEAAAGIR